MFEKLSKKELRKTMKDTLLSDDSVGPDESWVIEYNDGSSVTLSEGDSTKDVRLNGIKNAIYENSATSAFYGNDVKFYDFSAEQRAWQRERYPHLLESGKMNLDYNIQWRLDL